jgi:hypothetical protein
MEAISVAEFVAHHVALSRKTQAVIAAEAGFSTPNLITMIKKGDTKLPIVRVAPLARALDVDPVHLLRLALAEYQPENWHAIEGLIGNRLIADHEFAFLAMMREATGGTVIDARDPSVLERLQSLLADITLTAVADNRSAVRALETRRAESRATPAVLSSPQRKGLEGG